MDPYPLNNPYHLTASERRAVWFPKLSLPVIAAYTPESWSVDLVDEAVQDVDFDHPCDLVGISVMTCYAPRAYEIATEFRKRGKKVVLGGVHPTYCPEEALQFCDAVVCGEAEDLWPEVIADFMAGALQRKYKMTAFPALGQLQESAGGTVEPRCLHDPPVQFHHARLSFRLRVLQRVPL